MKCNILVTAALAVGMLAGMSAQAGGGMIKVTHAPTPYRGHYQAVPVTVVKAQPAVYQGRGPEIQVAVMASVPAQAAVRRSIFIHR
jgi:hypothetical protein